MRDYRAGATIDLEHSAADGDRTVTCALLVLWGERGMAGRLYDVMTIWRRHAVNVHGKASPPDTSYRSRRPPRPWPN